jgi:hypothetical protein
VRPDERADGIGVATDGSVMMLPVVGTGSHGPRASITSAADWNRSLGFLAIILEMTSDSACGTRPLSLSDTLGGSFNWCCMSFWAVVPLNGG